jgi:hypothetical protein
MATFADGACACACWLFLFCLLFWCWLFLCWFSLVVCLVRHRSCPYSTLLNSPVFALVLALIQLLNQEKILFNPFIMFYRIYFFLLLFLYIYLYIIAHMNLAFLFILHHVISDFFVWFWFASSFHLFWL